MRPVRVAVHAPDAITCAGISGYLATSPEVAVLPPGRRHEAEVVVLAAERLSSPAFAALREQAGGGTRPTVLVADRLSESDLLAAVECRVVAVLPRLAAADERLLREVLAAADRTDLVAPGLLRDLLGPTARGNEAASLRPREVDVLRLMAEGLTTAEIARRLNYSQRTIKNIVYACTRRLDLRNRPHAVAYAIRAGAI